MAYTATSWTVSVVSTDREMGRKKRVLAKLTLPTGNTIPTGGVPLPPIGKLGFVKKIDQLKLENHHPLTYATTRTKAMRWEINTSGYLAKAFKYSTATLAAAPSGGRMIRAQLTSITIDQAQVLMVTAVGF